jgi:hypothetical protein
MNDISLAAQQFTHNRLPVFLSWNEKENHEKLCAYIANTARLIADTLENEWKWSARYFPEPIREINKKLLDTYTNGTFQQIFEGITWFPYEQISLLKPYNKMAQVVNYIQGMLITWYTPSAIPEYMQIGSLDFITPGGGYKINEHELKYGFVNFEINNYNDVLIRHALLWIDQAIAQEIQEVCPELKDTIFRYQSMIWSKGNHDWYHHFVTIENTDLYRPHIPKYSSNYETHSGKVHALGFKKLFEKFPAKKKELVDHAMKYVNIILSSKLSHNAKEYLLLSYFFPFFRIISPRDTDTASLRETCKADERVDITDIFSTQRKAQPPYDSPEIRYQQVIHNYIDEPWDIILGDPKLSFAAIAAKLILPYTGQLSIEFEEE